MALLEKSWGWADAALRGGVAGSAGKRQRYRRRPTGEKDTHPIPSIPVTSILVDPILNRNDLRRCVKIDKKLKIDKLDVRSVTLLTSS